MKVTTFTTIARMKKDPLYEPAKKGNLRDATSLVMSLVDQTKIYNAMHQIKRPVMVCAIHALELLGINQIPMALAGLINRLGKYRLDDDIIQVNRTHHTGATAMHRLMHKPVFEGRVRRNYFYVLVDDVVTSGSTFKALTRFIESRDGMVAACFAMGNAYSRILGDGTRLHMDIGDWQTLAKFDTDLLIMLLRRHHVCERIDELTPSQVRYLASFKSLERLGAALAAAEQEGRSTEAISCLSKRQSS
jgi:hypothetical protein